MKNSKKFCITIVRERPARKNEIACVFNAYSYLKYRAMKVIFST